jgi:hypothetical protein
MFVCVIPRFRIASKSGMKVLGLQACTVWMQAKPVRGYTDDNKKWLIPKARKEAVPEPKPTSDDDEVDVDSGEAMSDTVHNTTMYPCAFLLSSMEQSYPFIL